MTEVRTMNTIWMYADAQPSLETAARTKIDPAARHGASLIVVGVLESTDDPLLKTTVGGSVAESILSQLLRSALVVKRPGFVSPVRARK